MPADMKVNFRSKVNELGLKGKRAEGQVLKSAGEVLASKIADLINYSNNNSATYKHLADNIVVSNTKTNQFGERYVQISAIKELGYRLKFLEFGTSKMSAQAPMTIGSDMAKDEVAKTLSEGIERIMRL
ncbi:HK97-gp10 family putative phage morphogenesis protein [Rossellomorea sp. BNER]|uniref:HK97-gp10 family putative phage morphogenesis protein n=1 Tax=Rossellomorea sp. BNER TaxID=2962031 RepID=UPI003AF2415A